MSHPQLEYDKFRDLYVFSCYIKLNGEWRKMHTQLDREIVGKKEFRSIYDKCISALNKAYDQYKINKYSSIYKFESLFLETCKLLFTNEKNKYFKCECGAKKCKTTHIYWCPLYASNLK
jgi:hypothetical protein